MSKSEPIFNIPSAVIVASGLMIATQVVRGFLPDELDLTVLLTLAFIPARYSGAALELPGGYVTSITSFVTYMVVHGGWVHLLVNVLWMLAFGSAVAQRIGDRGFYTFSILCGVAGALTHLAFHWGEMAPVVGASAAISGQMAGALRFIFFAKRRPGAVRRVFVCVVELEPGYDRGRLGRERPLQRGRKWLTVGTQRVGSDAHQVARVGRPAACGSEPERSRVIGPRHAPPGTGLERESFHDRLAIHRDVESEPDRAGGRNAAADALRKDGGWLDRLDRGSCNCSAEGEEECDQHGRCSERDVDDGPMITDLCDQCRWGTMRRTAQFLDRKQ